MVSYSFKALSLNKKELVSFTLEDGPILQDAKSFALINRPGSPILRYNTIMKGCDIPRVYEGDIIEYHGKEYIIHNEIGFCAISLDGERIYLDDLDEIKVVNNMYFQNKFKVFSKKCTFKYVEKTEKRFLGGEREFGFRSIMGGIAGKPLISIYGAKLSDASDIRMFTGIRYKGKRIYFGDEIEGSIVYMERGRVKMKVNGLEYDLRKNNSILLQLEGKYDAAYKK